MQYELNLRDYLRIFQKRRWVIILMPILAGLFGYFATPVPAVTWEAVGRIRVSKRVMPSQVLLEAYYYWEEGSTLATHAQVITSRETLKKTAIRLGYIPADITDEELSQRQDYIGFIEELGSSLAALPVEQTSLIEVVGVRPLPDEAVRWVNALMDTYVEQHTFELNREAIESRRYIETQLVRYEEALRASEDALTAFQLENADAVSFQEDELGRTQQALQDIDFELRTLDLQMEILEQAWSSEALPNFSLLTRIAPGDPTIQDSLLKLVDLEQQRRQLLTYQTTRSPEVETLTDEMETHIAILYARLEADRDRLNQEKAILEARFQALPANDVTLARLERDVTLNERTYSVLREEYQRAGLREAERIQELTVVERAVSATRVAAQGRASKAVVAALIGLLLGVVLALILETLDTSIGAIEDVETLLQIPVIGIVPPIDFDDTKHIIGKVSPELVNHPDIDRLASLVAHYDPRSPVAEAYRSLRTNIEQSREEVEGKVFIITSSVLEEGKTTTSANLALVYAQMGRKTLLLTADLRRPDVHKIFGLEKDPGLADVLTGSLPWQDVVRSLSDMLLGELSMDVVMLTPGMDNLHIMPAGTNPLNPAELLSSDATGELVNELRGEFDLIIIDTPPVIPVTDSAIMSEHADGIVLVYEVGKVGRDVLKRAVGHMESVKARIWGIVMNDVKAEAETSLRDTDYQYYRYRYERDETRRRARLSIPVPDALGRLFGRRGR